MHAVRSRPSSASRSTRSMQGATRPTSNHSRQAATSFVASRPAPKMIRCVGRIVRPGSAADTMKDRKSTRLNSSHVAISYAVFCLKKKTISFCVGEVVYLNGQCGWAEDNRVLMLLFVV